MNKNFVYHDFLKEIKERIRSAQYDALKAVNKAMILLYWDIGRMIVERQKKHGWGRAIVENLAKDLQFEFPGMQGFSVQNLWYMRQFYMEYHKNTKLQPLVGEISWTKHLIIMAQCKDDLEREFYTRMTKRMGWTKNVLIHQMQFYLAALDNTIREKGENPSIGIILCKDKGRTTVEYALKVSKKPIAVAQYRITPTLPKDLQKELPAPAQIRALLDGMGNS
jgi:predicted nuclease of restriction endonuclease-like (RecB) superfamily